MAQGDGDARRTAGRRDLELAESVHGLSHGGDLRARVGLTDLSRAGIFRWRRRRGQLVRNRRQQVARALGTGQDGTVELSDLVRVGEGGCGRGCRRGAGRHPVRRSGGHVPNRRDQQARAGLSCATPAAIYRQTLLAVCGSGDYFLKLGTDSPETLLAYADFDGTIARRPQVPLHTYTPHVQDWRAGDATWKDGKGKGLIGAMNYLAAKGVNAISFLPYNAGGDGDNIWPFVSRDDKFHYDVSKLDQWQSVFDYAQQRGIYLHFKLQETEIDDNVRGNPTGGGAAVRAGRGPVETGPVRESLDGGDLGPERSLYVRELVARFGYLLALNWNLGEENTQSREQQLAMAMHLRDTDPYAGHHIVVHTFPNAQESVYASLLGALSPFTGASLQMAWNTVHERTLRWVLASAQAKKPWVVANDEQGPAGLGVPPDPGYAGFAGKDAQGRDVGYTLHDIRKYSLWGNLMAGGAGVEYYFGYGLPDNDVVAENFRSRDKTWDYGRIAVDFFHSQKIPFWEMANANALVGNEKHDNSRYCFAKASEVYLVYLPLGGTATLDLSKASGQFVVEWFDPRNGGPLKKGSGSVIKAKEEVIFVPSGDESDPTRAPAFYNETYEYLTGLGVVEL
jgi:hypothetical protein